MYQDSYFPTSVSLPKMQNLNVSAYIRQLILRDILPASMFQNVKVENDGVGVSN